MFEGAFSTAVHRGSGWTASAFQSSREPDVVPMTLEK